MGRLRARLAGNEIEREFRSHLAEAERHLERAAETCRRAVKAGSRDGEKISRRADDSLRSVKTALSVIRGIGNLASGIDLADSDFIPEAERNRLAREARREKRKKLVPVHQRVE